MAGKTNCCQLPVDSSRVKNFVEMALSRSVSEINAFLHFTQKFKMAAKSDRKRFSGKVASRRCRYPAVQKFCQNHSILLRFQDKGFLDFMQKFKMATKSGGKTSFQNSRQQPISSPISKINAFLHFTPIQDGHQKWQEKEFWEKLPVNAADTLRVKNFLPKSLYLAYVSEINAFLRKFKMAAKSGGKTIFWKKSPVDSADALWVKNFVEITLSRSVSDINIFLCLRKFMTAAKSGAKTIFWEKSPVNFADTLRVKNFIEITLSRSVSEINAFLHILLKIFDIYLCHYFAPNKTIAITH